MGHSTQSARLRTTSEATTVPPRRRHRHAPSGVPEEDHQMHSRFRRTGALVGTGAVLFGALAVVAGNQANAEQDPVPLDKLLGQPLQGKAALGKVQPRLAELAERNGLGEQQLQRILATDKTSWLDKDGKL